MLRYLALCRDNIGLPGLAKFFKEGSDEEREHAQMLITFQNIRGGRVKLMGIVAPETEYQNKEKGDAQYAMELALSLEVCISSTFLLLSVTVTQSVTWLQN